MHVESLLLQRVWPIQCASLTLPDQSKFASSTTAVWFFFVDFPWQPDFVQVLYRHGSMYCVSQLRAFPSYGHCLNLHCPSKGVCNAFSCYCRRPIQVLLMGGTRIQVFFTSYSPQAWCNVRYCALQIVCQSAMQATLHKTIHRDCVGCSLHTLCSLQPDNQPAKHNIYGLWALHCPGNKGGLTALYCVSITEMHYFNCRSKPMDT